MEILKHAAALAAASVVALGAVLAADSRLAADIEQNRRRWERNLLTAALAGIDYDSLAAVKISSRLDSARLSGGWTARRQRTPAATVLRATVDGYGGDIDFLAVFNRRRELTGLRIIDHRETPGIADFLRDEPIRAVDGVSGASITADAIMRATKEMAAWLWENDLSENP